MSMYKTPFSDAIESAFPGTKSSNGGEYDKQEVPGTPGRDGGLLPELSRDGFSKSPSVDGPYKTPFKDKVG